LVRLVMAFEEARPTSLGVRTCGVKEALCFGQKNHTVDARVYTRNLHAFLLMYSVS
jgi:hypothetical protein